MNKEPDYHAFAVEARDLCLEMLTWMSFEGFDTHLWDQRLYDLELACGGGMLNPWPPERKENDND